MKNLKEYINEALKTVKSVDGDRIESNNYDIVQVIDRKFKEGISDEDFKKFIKQDVDEVFGLKESQLCKDMDKVIDDLIDKEIKHKMPEIARFAERKYKSPSARDKYIESSKEEIRQRIISSRPAREIVEVQANLNPIYGFPSDRYITFRAKGHTGDGGYHKYNSKTYTWGDEAVEAALKLFDKFSAPHKDGKEIRLRDGVIGWTISYAAYNGTKCPKSGTAYLNLKFNKETEATVKRVNKAYDDSVSAYYDEKGPGEYTGD